MSWRYSDDDANDDVLKTPFAIADAIALLILVISKQVECAYVSKKFRWKIPVIPVRKYKGFICIQVGSSFAL